jgi:DNA invertase Pin-like site-specific DNA recombinase
MEQFVASFAHGMKVADGLRAGGQHIGRTKALDKSKTALAQRMHASGESASTIAAALNVSHATIYRVLAEQAN